MASTETEIVVPEMIGWDALTKILLAYLKAGGDKEEKSSKEVAEISGTSESNVSRNIKFFASLGLLETKKEPTKLTQRGADYARALDWGRLDEAKTVLRKEIKDKPLVAKTFNYVDINKSVRREDLTAKIASFANVKNESRYATGIRAFVQMLVTCEFLNEDEFGTLTIGMKETSGEDRIEFRFPHTQTHPKIPEKEKHEVLALPINITINVDGSMDIERLKMVIKAIKEALLSET